MHVMIDEPDNDMDTQIATHIVKVHQRRERAFNVPYTMAQVQRYIRYARSIKPQINAQVRLFKNSQGAEAATTIHATSIRPACTACAESARTANAQDCKASSTSDAAYHTSRTFKLLDLCRPRMFW